MKYIRYIELKTGYNDNGPTWIGNVKESKSGKTIYFNDHAFQKYHGAFSNYIDIETGDEYWISHVKKNGEDRHWAGSGKITIDRKVKRKFSIRLFVPNRSGNIIGLDISDTIFIMLHAPHKNRNYFHLQIDVKIVKNRGQLRGFH